MTTVNSKSDIKEALKRGETEFYTTNKTLLSAAALVAKFQSLSLPMFTDKLKSIEGVQNFAISELTIITVTMMVCITAIALYGLFKEYDVDVDYDNGKIKLRKRK